MTGRLYGHDEAWASFVAAAHSPRAPHAWLLVGTQGVGKALFAQHAAAWQVAPPTPGMTADPLLLSRVAAGHHPDVLTLRREVHETRRDKSDEPARNITIAQVRAVLAKLRTRPTEAERRVVIIDSIDDCEASAANALLKSLEEPPETTIFLLISHAPGRLLPTIRSRCRTLRLAPLDAVSMTEWIGAVQPALDRAAVAAIIDKAAGIPARAVALFDGVRDDVAALLRQIAQTGDPTNVQRSDLARRLALVGERARFRDMLDTAEHVAATHARTQNGAALAQALAVRDRIQELRRYAVSGSEDQATVSFAIGSALAQLAPPRP